MMLINTMKREIKFGLTILFIGIIAIGGCIWKTQNEEIEQSTTPEPETVAVEEVVNRIEGAYSGLENFAVTVESYRGKPGQSREEMAFLHRFKFYFQLDGAKSYAEVTEASQAASVDTYEPLRIIGEMDQYEGVVLKGEEKLGERNTYLLEWKGKENAGLSLGWKMWIDNGRWTVVGQDMYSGNVLGMKTRYEYKKIDGYWLPKTVKSEYPTGNRMKINVRSGYQVNIEFSEGVRERLK